MNSAWKESASEMLLFKLRKCLAIQALIRVRLELIIMAEEKPRFYCRGVFWMVLSIVLAGWTQAFQEADQRNSLMVRFLVISICVFLVL